MPDKSWPPTRYTQPLAADFPTLGDNLIRFAELAWTTPENPKGLELDRWQRELVRHVLQVYPAGHPNAGELVYRQVVISIPRQQGKSTLGALFALFGLLMHVAGPYVLGIASSADTARIVYDRVLYAINAQPELAALFAKTTETRGIRTADGAGRYEVKASKGAALQGLPVSLVIFDELHISKRELWGAVVEGMKTRRNGLVIGITTAGGDDSELLIELYARGARAIAGDDERFGFFVWEAPAGCAIDADAILASNPAVACGRIPLERLLDDVQGRADHDVRRYTLNQFTSATDAAWMQPGEWSQLTNTQLPGKPTHFAVAVGPSWSWATITVSAKHEGRVYVETVARIERTSLDQLETVCRDLAGRYPDALLVMESVTLKALALRLRDAGYRTEYLTAAQMTQVAATSHALIKRGQVAHDHFPVIAQQFGRGAVKPVNDAWRIVPVKNAVIDALMAMVIAVWAAESLKQPELIIV